MYYFTDALQFLQDLNALKVFLNIWVVTGIFFTAHNDLVNLTCSVGKQPEYDVCFWFKTNQINSDWPCRSPPQNLSRVSTKTALRMIIRPIFTAVFWLTLQSAEGQLWAILVCSTPISSQSFTPLLSSSMKNSARTSSPAKRKGTQWKVPLNANDPAFSHGQPWRKDYYASYNPDLIPNSFSCKAVFFFPFTQSFLLKVSWKTAKWRLGRVLCELPQPHIVNHRHPRSPNKDHVDWIYIGNTNYNSENTMCRRVPVLRAWNFICCTPPVSVVSGPLGLTIRWVKLLREKSKNMPFRTLRSRCQ